MVYNFYRNGGKIFEDKRNYIWSIFREKAKEKVGFTNVSYLQKSVKIGLSAKIERT